MTTPSLQLSPIPASIENPGDWDGIASQISAQAGVPTTLTKELVANLVGSAVPLLFEADATQDMNPLRGTFSDQLVAQCQRNAGTLGGGRPTSVVVHLIGAPHVGGHAAVRMHLSIQVQAATGSSSVSRQYWDVEPTAQVTVGQTSCPNCGAPVENGALICEHCGTDVRQVAQAPLVVSRLELY